MCTNPLITYKIGNEIIDVKKLAFKGDITKGFKKEEIIELPCGKCLECRKRKLMEMKTRLIEELKNSKNAFFLTLTYDDEHLKNLNKKDMQDFLKRYRKKTDLRYFYVGELGETTARPHYHAIIFAELPEDLEETTRPTKKGYKNYTSKQIQTIWKNGLISISKMELPLIGYILKYMMKSSKNKDFICDWSRKPPIGINPEKIEERIQTQKRTKAEKRYYKNHIGEIPELENEIEQHQMKLEEIERKTKMPYYQYIKQKRI